MKAIMRGWMDERGVWHVVDLMDTRSGNITTLCAPTRELGECRTELEMFPGPDTCEDCCHRLAMAMTYRGMSVAERKG